MLARTTLSGRRVLALGVLAAGLLTVTAVLAVPLAARSAEQPVAAPEPTPTPTPVPTSEPEEPGPTIEAPGPAIATDDPAPSGTVVTSMTPPPTVVAPSEEEQAEARQVAADFAAAYATYRYDDPPGTPLERLRPWVTEELVDELARSAGGGSLALREGREVGVGVVEAVQMQALGSDWMDLVAVVRIDVTADETHEQRWTSTLIRVLRTPQGWRVAGFQP